MGDDEFREESTPHVGAGSGGWEGGGLEGGYFATYGRSPKKPTVGRHHDLPWVASTTYSRFP